MIHCSIPAIPPKNGRPGSAGSYGRASAKETDNGNGSREDEKCDRPFPVMQGKKAPIMRRSGGMRESRESGRGCRVCPGDGRPQWGLCCCRSGRREGRKDRVPVPLFQKRCSSRSGRRNGPVLFSAHYEKVSGRKPGSHPGNLTRSLPLRHCCVQR